MDNRQFDHLARALSRRGTLAGLLAGLAVPLMPGAAADAKKKKKKCKAGLLTCKIKKGKKKKKLCVDGQTDPANCGACGVVCPAGQACCAGACVNTRDDETNCGACGNVCTLPQTCGGSGTPGVCGCTPTTCEAEGKNCGQIPDACGNTLACGECTESRQTCGGGGTPNVCGCLADGVEFAYEGSCDPCCSGDCCYAAPGIRVCAGGCG